MSRHTHGKPQSEKNAIPNMHQYLRHTAVKAPYRMTGSRDAIAESRGCTHALELPREVGVIPQVAEGGIVADALRDPATVRRGAGLPQVQNHVAAARLRRGPPGLA